MMHMKLINVGPAEFSPTEVEHASLKQFEEDLLGVCYFDYSLNPQINFQDYSLY